MEIETLEAIYNEDFEKDKDVDNTYKLKLLPYPNNDRENKVGIILEFSFPEGYPDEILSFRLLPFLGVNNQQCLTLEKQVLDEAYNNKGFQMVYQLSVLLKDWLDKNNDEEIEQGAKEESGEGELYLEFEGTPCTEDTYNEWFKGFKAEMDKFKDKSKLENRMTGKMIFSQIKEKDKTESVDIDWELIEQDDDTNIEDIILDEESEEKDEKIIFETTEIIEDPNNPNDDQDNLIDEEIPNEDDEEDKKKNKPAN